MVRALILHPDSRCAAVTRIEAEAVRRPGTLDLCFRVSGDADKLRLPPSAAPQRTDGLWRHTCFEAFIRIGNGGAYCEFNLAPSGQWAAYGFSGYREGMRPLDLPPPRIETRPHDGGVELHATLKTNDVPGLPDNAPWMIGLSAVIEEADSNKSYWALAHPPGKADFHHSGCYVLEIPAACPP